MTLKFGAGVTQISFQPATTAELVLEFDGRWSPDRVKQRVEADWPSACRSMLAKILVELLTDVA